MGTIFKGCLGVVIFLIFVGALSFFMTTRMMVSKSTDNQQVSETVDNSEQTSSNKKNKDTKKNNEKKKTGLILDIPMDGTPIENITEVVKQNSDGSAWGIIKFGDIKIDTSSGEAKVLILLQGARGLTAHGTLEEFNRIIKQDIAALYQVNTGIKIANVKVNVYMKVTSSKTGAEENLLAYSVSMDKKTASQMHWENYKSIDIMNAATDLAMHPLFRNEIQSNAGKSTLDESLETLGF